MKKALFLVFGMLIILSSSTQAFSGISPGLRLGITTGGGHLFIGGDLLFRLSPRVYANPNLELIFWDGGTHFSLNADVHYRFGSFRGRPLFWAGGGLAFIRSEPEGRGRGANDLGLNLLFGLGFPTRTGLLPFIQIKATWTDNTGGELAFGLWF